MHTSQYQLPLRLTDTLALELKRASALTGIHKSRLCRMGISRLLREIRSNGTTETMTRLHSMYQEIV
jgi:hypothetical protein